MKKNPTFIGTAQPSELNAERIDDGVYRVPSFTRVRVAQAQLVRAHAPGAQILASLDTRDKGSRGRKAKRWYNWFVPSALATQSWATPGLRKRAWTTEAARKNPSGVANYAAYLRLKARMGYKSYQSDVDYVATARRYARKNPLGDTWAITHANPAKRLKKRKNVPSSGPSWSPAAAAAAAAGPKGNPGQNPSKAQRRYHAHVKAGHYDAAGKLIKRIRAGKKGALKQGKKLHKNPLLANPAYRVTFDSPSDTAGVRSALKAAGFDGIKVKGGKKRAPGPYALFVKAKMPGLMARGLSAGNAMKQVAVLWREKKGGRANPKKRRSSRGRR